jgi:molybdopterin-guanine dinucleotide biosynthesis protein A
MGRDKATLPYHGATLAQTVAETVRAAAGNVTLVGKLHAGAIPDLYPGEGPLGGILTALRDSAADWNLIVACDMPELNSGFLRQLLDAAEESRSDALVAAGPSGRLEPLCAVYHRRCYPRLSEAFARGVRKIAAGLAEVSVSIWRVPQELSCFQNVNTPEDWAPYER